METLKRATGVVFTVLYREEGGWRWGKEGTEGSFGDNWSLARGSFS